MYKPFTKHFSFEEFTKTSHDNLQLQNTQLALGSSDNIFSTMCVLEYVRKIYSMPITITSGYRSYVLNSAVNGATNSKHLIGRAADICPAVPHDSVMFDKYMLQLSNAVDEVRSLGLISYVEKHKTYIHINLP